MDRNPNELYGTPGSSTGGTGSNPQNTGAGYGTGGAGSTGSPGFGRTEGVTGREYADTGIEGSTEYGERDVRSRAKEKLGQARDTASEKLGEAHRKAHDIKMSVADKLDAQAERLRARGTSTSAYATAEPGMSAITTNDSTSTRVGDKVAGGMHSTAEWLRNNDLDSMKRNVEEQVRTNPGRSLLVAAVAGYLIGKAIRRR